MFHDKDEYIKSVASRLKRAREALKLTQADIAIPAKLTVRAYVNYENGGRPVPIEILNVCSTHGIDMNWILTGEGEMFLNQQQAPDREPAVEGIPEEVAEIVQILMEMPPKVRKKMVQILKDEYDLELMKADIKALREALGENFEVLTGKAKKARVVRV